jgi:hypothetical protein
MALCRGSLRSRLPGIRNYHDVDFRGSFLHPAVGRESGFSVQELVINLMMINAYVGARFFTAPMWFIPFIFQVYILIPLLCRLIRWPQAALAMTTAVSVLTSMLAYRVAPLQAAEICRTWSPVFRLPPVFLGVALGMLPSSKWPQVVMTFAICVVSETALIFVLPDMQLTLIRQMQGLVALVLLTLLAVLVARLVSAIPSVDWWTTLLGQASFPVFHHACCPGVVHLESCRWGRSPFGSHTSSFAGWVRPPSRSFTAPE